MSRTWNLQWIYSSSNYIPCDPHMQRNDWLLSSFSHLQFRNFEEILKTIYDLEMSSKQRQWESLGKLLNKEGPGSKNSADFEFGTASRGPCIQDMVLSVAPLESGAASKKVSPSGRPSSLWRLFWKRRLELQHFFFCSSLPTWEVSSFAPAQDPSCCEHPFHRLPNQSANHGTVLVKAWAEENFCLNETLIIIDILYTDEKMINIVNMRWDP